VKKLVVESAYGVGGSQRGVPRVIKAVFRFVLRDQMKDKELQESLVRESGLDWTIVRPVALTNRKPRGEVHAETGLKVRKATLPRRDLGRFLSRLVDGPRFLHRAVSVSG
jgi:uncharacterized protein YbjT (DUF2867 family)